MADDPRLFKIDRRNLHACLACPLPECAYLQPRFTTQCPIILLEVTYRSDRQRRRAYQRKTQSIQSPISAGKEDYGNRFCRETY